MKPIILPRIRIITIIILSMLSWMFCSLTGCTSPGSNMASAGRPDPCVTRSGFCFDTLISITIYNSTNDRLNSINSNAGTEIPYNGASDEALLDECFDMCSRYEGLLSMTVSGSDISKINAAAAQEAVPVSSDTIDFIEAAVHYYELSHGRLDISVAPLTQQWTDARNNGTPPDDDTIASLLPHTGLDKLTYDRSRNIVTKSDTRLMLDPGALGKGFVADRLRELLLSRGVTSAIISLGGNIVTIGSKPDGSDFRIGIKQPFSEHNDIAASLRVKNRSVVTSGVYERCFLYEDRLYHHILDPADGRPADTDLYSATIISESSLDGDALSTICLLIGSEDAEALIENTPGIEAVFITKDNELIYTEGAENYIEL